MKKVLVFLVLVGAIAAFLYFPRTAAVVSAANAATLAVLNTAVEGSRAGSSFAPALDGEAHRVFDADRRSPREIDGLFYHGALLLPAAIVR